MNKVIVKRECKIFISFTDGEKFMLPCLEFTEDEAKGIWLELNKVFSTSITVNTPTFVVPSDSGIHKEMLK